MRRKKGIPTKTRNDEMAEILVANSSRKMPRKELKRKKEWIHIVHVI